MLFVALGLCAGVYYSSKLLEDCKVTGGKVLNSWWCVNFYPQGFSLGWIDLLARNETEFLHQVQGIEYFGLAACSKPLICIWIKPSIFPDQAWQWPVANTSCRENKAEQSRTRLSPECKSGQKKSLSYSSRPTDFFKQETVSIYIFQMCVVLETKVPIFFIFLTWSVKYFWGCIIYLCLLSWNTIVRVLKEQKFICSQIWRLEMQAEGVRFGICFRTSHLDLLIDECLLWNMVFLCVYIPNLFLYRDRILLASS